MKSLQLRERKQIAEPRKYCLVCDYFSLAYIFLYFCISQVWEFRTYSHQLLSNLMVHRVNFLFTIQSNLSCAIRILHQPKPCKRVTVPMYLLNGQKIIYKLHKSYLNVQDVSNIAAVQRCQRPPFDGKGNMMPIYTIAGIIITFHCNLKRKLLREEIERERRLRFQ